MLDTNADKEASTNILKDVQTDIDRMLSDDTVSDRELLKGVLRALKTRTPFMIQSLEDHIKVEKMWNTYRLMAWVMSAVGVLAIGFLWGIFTGRVELIFK